MTGPIKCADCAWFKPYEHNPTAAMGECRHENAHGYWYAQQMHRCKDHEPTGDGDAANEA